MELDVMERKAEKKKIDMEQYLSHAAICTRLHPHLMQG
jgi:hypothetical protein